MMRSRFSLLLVLMIMIIGHFSIVSAQDTIDIAVLLPDNSTSARWEQDDRRFLTEAFEAAGVSYWIVNAENDVVQQIMQAEEAIERGAKVILLVNLDSGTGAYIIDIARSNDVAVIDYDRLTIEGDGADFYVSFNNEAVGQLQGAGLINAVASAGMNNPNIVILNGSPTDNNATLYKAGYDSFLNPLFDSGLWNEVDDQSVPQWDNQQGQNIFEQIQTRTGCNGIDAAIAANDGLASAIIAARENAGCSYIPLTGQDATVEGLQNILAGKQSVTVYKAIKAQAEAAANLAIAIVNEEDTSALVNGEVDNGTNMIASVLLTPIQVTKYNIGATVIADGFRTIEEICTDDFVMYCEEVGLIPSR